MDSPLHYLTGPWRAGPLRGKAHAFNKGEGLAVHEHTESTNHITIVLRGSFVLSGRPAIEGKVIVPGDILDWEVGEPHGFTALEDDSCFIQISKATRPE